MPEFSCDWVLAWSGPSHQKPRFWLGRLVLERRRMAPGAPSASAGDHHGGGHGGCQWWVIFNDLVTSNL